MRVTQQALTMRQELQEVARTLHDQALDMNSPLRNGKHTRRTRMVLSKTHTVHHTPHAAVEPAVFAPNLNEMTQAVERRMRLRDISSLPGEDDR